MRISDWSSDVCSSDLPSIAGKATAMIRSPSAARGLTTDLALALLALVGLASVSTVSAARGDEKPPAPPPDMRDVKTPAPACVPETSSPIHREQIAIAPSRDRVCQYG